MKKIISGKIYDTEKSDFVGTATATCPTNDFSYWEASLYRTPRSKSFFLVGEGGPMTRWGRRVSDNSTTWGAGLFPLDKTEALAWAEQYLDTETVEEFFGDIIEEA